MQGEGEEEETDELVGQVLDEIGITLNGELVGVPGKEAEAAKQVCMHMPLRKRFPGPAVCAHLMRSSMQQMHWGDVHHAYGGEWWWSLHALTARIYAGVCQAASCAHGSFCSGWRRGR